MCGFGKCLRRDDDFWLWVDIFEATSRVKNCVPKAKEFQRPKLCGTPSQSQKKWVPKLGHTSVQSTYIHFMRLSRSR